MDSCDSRIVTAQAALLVKHNLCVENNYTIQVMVQFRYLWQPWHSKGLYSIRMLSVSPLYSSDPLICFWIISKERVILNWVHDVSLSHVTIYNFHRIRIGSRKRSATSLFI
jgi:hypothetical protein